MYVVKIEIHNTQSLERYIETHTQNTTIMGAGASFETEGHLYHARSCGCIYRCEYNNTIVSGNVELVKCCYNCLERLKKYTFDYAIVDELSQETRGQSVDSLIASPASKWMSQVSALAYADKHDIRSVEEFLYNTNILWKCGSRSRK
jgi:hypothetical protein